MAFALSPPSHSLTPSMCVYVCRAICMHFYKCVRNYCRSKPSTSTSTSGAATAAGARAEACLCRDDDAANLFAYKLNSSFMLALLFGGRRNLLLPLSPTHHAHSIARSVARCRLIYHLALQAFYEFNELLTSNQPSATPPILLSRISQHCVMHFFCRPLCFCSFALPGISN